MSTRLLVILLACGVGLTPVGAQCPLVELLPPGTAFGDRFGESLDMQAGVLWVGAPGWSSSAGANAQGRVFRLASDGTLLGSFVAGDGADGDGFGTDVAQSDDVVLVGAPGHDVPVSDAGVAWLYRFDGLAWQPLRLQAPAPRIEGGFGTAVDVASELAAVAEVTPQGVLRGRVHVFRRAGIDWLHEATLEDPAATPNGDDFGVGLVLDGERLFVGAPRRLNPDGSRGAVLVFAHGSTDWSLVDTLPNPTGLPGTHFGEALDHDSTRLAVGYPTDGVLSGLPGRVLVYTEDATGFTLDQTLVGFTLEDGFGAALDLAGDQLLVGAPMLLSSSSNPTGRAFLYEHDGNAFTLAQELRAPVSTTKSVHFGADVALDDGRAAVGARQAVPSNHLTGVSLFDTALLPWLDTWVVTGTALPGSGNTPGLVVEGCFCEGGNVHAIGFLLGTLATPWLIVGLDTLLAPFKGGVLVPRPDVVVGPFQAGSSGQVLISIPVSVAIPPSTTLALQLWIPDPGAPHGAAATIGMVGISPP